MEKWLEYLVSELFSNRKCRGLGPWLGRPRLLRLTVNQGAWGGGSSSELGLAVTRSTGAHRRGCNRERGKWGSRLGPHRGSGEGGEVARWRR
jgi:hypothetical protein